MKITRYIGYFSLILTLFIFSIFFINLFEEKEVNFPERNLPLGEIKTFDGNLLDVSLLKKNEFSLLNVWATWCINCKLEHGFLMAKKAEGWNIVGLNYKDDLEKAFKWLDQYGNPYFVNLYDQDGTYGFTSEYLGHQKLIFLKRIKFYKNTLASCLKKFGKINLFP